MNDKNIEAERAAPELLPCPFCGGKAEYEEDWDANYSNQVACTQCPAAVQVTRGDFTRWNRRASPVVGDDGLPPLHDFREDEAFAEMIDDLHVALKNWTPGGTTQPYVAAMQKMNRYLRDRIKGAIAADRAARAQQQAQSVDTPEFQTKVGHWLSAREYYQSEDAEQVQSAWHALIAYIDGRTAGAAPADPMDWPIPCDVTVGAGTNKKGTTLRTLVARMKTLHGMATEGFGHKAINASTLVNRFLAWPLPDTLSARLVPNIKLPIGTHLMNADEAKAMFAYVLAASPSPQQGKEGGND